LTDSDGNVSAPATATITVEGVESAPATSWSIPENQSWSVPAGVLLTGATDTDTPATCCTVTLDTPASDGTVTVDSNGGFTYTPDSGFEGSDSFTYLLTDSDGNVSAPTAVTMNVGTPATTRMKIVVDPPASGPGDTVTIVATVTQPCDCGPVPTGTVTVTYDTDGGVTGTAGSAPMVNGTATITTNNLPAGDPPNFSVILNDTYGGDAFNAASNGMIPYYVKPGCSVGPWPPWTEGGSVQAGGPEGYYISQTNGVWAVYVTHSTLGKVTFSGTVTTNGLILDVSSTKNEEADRVTLVGKHKLEFKIVNRGDVDGFMLYAGCGSYIDFTLDIGSPPRKAKKTQIYVGDGTHPPKNGRLDVTRT
jgi:hypothetical protein